MGLIKNIIKLILAVIFGLYFTHSFQLAFIYHDYSLALMNAIIGFVVMCIYFIIIYYDHKKQEE